MPHRGETEAQREVKRLAFEERRVGRVDGHIWELERDHPEIFKAVEQNIIHVPYYETKEEQDRFLNSIADTKIGAQMLRMQDQWNRDYRIPLILPKFTNFPNVSLEEQQWLAMFGMVIEDRPGFGQTIGVMGKPGAYERINDDVPAYVHGDPLSTVEYRKLTGGRIPGEADQTLLEISVNPGLPEADREVVRKIIGVGTGFERGQAYQAPAEPTVVSGIKPFEKPERVSVFQPKKILSPKIKKIIDDWSVKKIIVPAWFANNNMNWVLEGRITEQEFLDAYTNLVNTGAITSTTPQVTIAPIPEITIPSIPEVSAEMELITTNFQVKLDNIIQFSSSLSNADYKRLQDEMSLEPKITLVFLNQTDFNPLSNFSKILRQIQNLLRGQVVETITISPTGQVITAPEPTEAGKTGLMGMGVLGVIGILMLGGFIADHVRKRK